MKTNLFKFFGFMLLLCAALLVSAQPKKALPTNLQQPTSHSKSTNIPNGFAMPNRHLGTLGSTGCSTAGRLVRKKNVPESGLGLE